MPHDDIIVSNYPPPGVTWEENLPYVDTVGVDATATAQVASKLGSMYKQGSPPSLMGFDTAATFVDLAVMYQAIQGKSLYALSNPTTFREAIESTLVHFNMNSSADTSGGRTVEDLLQQNMVHGTMVSLHTGGDVRYNNSDFQVVVYSGSEWSSLLESLGYTVGTTTYSTDLGSFFWGQVVQGLWGHAFEDFFSSPEFKDVLRAYRESFENIPVGDPPESDNFLDWPKTWQENLLQYYKLKREDEIKNKNAVPPPPSMLTSWFNRVLTLTVGDNIAGTDYKEVYTAFFGNDPNELKDALTVFISQTAGKYGYFLPGHHFNEWVEFVTNKYMETQDINLGQQDLGIIMRILVLLSKMVDTLQRVSAAQAQRLTFYANWQRAYTQLLEDVPMMQSSWSASWGSSGATKFQGWIGEFQERIRSHRDVVKDETKTFQTALNQSTEASNQQANIASGILQQLSTILSQIFR